MLKALLLVLLAVPAFAERPTYTTPGSPRPGDLANQAARLGWMTADMNSNKVYVKAWLDEFYLDGAGVGTAGRYCQVLTSRVAATEASDLPIVHDRKDDAPHYTPATSTDCLGDMLLDNELVSVTIDIYTFGFGADDRGAYVTYTLDEPPNEIAVCGYKHCHLDADQALCNARLPANQNSCVAKAKP